MKILIYIISFIVIGIPILLLIAIQTEGTNTALPAVASVSATAFVGNLIIKKYYPDSKDKKEEKE
jgi:hypothetical protein